MGDSPKHDAGIHKTADQETTGLGAAACCIARRRQRELLGEEGHAGPYYDYGQGAESGWSEESSQVMSAAGKAER